MSEYPAPETLEFTSRAVVATDRPERYAKQLVSHLGRKIPSVEIEGGHRLTFNRDDNFSGYGDVVVEQNGDGVAQLVLTVYAPSAESLAGPQGGFGSPS